MNLAYFIFVNGTVPLKKQIMITKKLALIAANVGNNINM